MLQPENQSKQYEHLFADIDEGRMKIPRFQRDFVWTDNQTAALLDSIVKGFPIGTFILWKTREEMRHIKNIGNITLPKTPDGDATLYVLDGQQRITSLYAVRKGIRLTKDGKEIDYRRISINLHLDPDGDEQIVTADTPPDCPCISVYALLNSPIDELARQFLPHLNKIAVYQQRLKGYLFSTILISDYPIDIACEIFTRINTGGTTLTLFEIMVAKTYDQERGFDLALEYDRLINDNGTGKDLEDVGYDAIPASTVLQCIAAHLRRQVRARDILRLKRQEVIDCWPVVKEAIFTAVDYCRNYLRIPVSILLPYDALLVPFCYFFVHNSMKMPTSDQHGFLCQYFWWASLNNRFSSGVEGKLSQDFQRMDRILSGLAPDYKSDDQLHLTLDDLRFRWFSAGDAFCKAILCLYAYYQPKSFASNSLVQLDNAWLKVAFSKNYHHFFPKSYLDKKGFEYWQANSVLNITLVDDYLNKQKIGARPPSAYMQEFAKSNPELSQTMQTHLIDDMVRFGVWSDDYSAFLEQRGQRVLDEIKKRVGSGLFTY